MAMKYNCNIACIQPFVPHYRKQFFEKLNDKCGKFDVFVYEPVNNAHKKGFSIEDGNVHHIGNWNIHKFLLYDIISLMKYDTLILMLDFCHLTTWFLLLTKFLHKKKIILWGQGISVKRYLQEEKNPNILLRWMIALSDGAWIYMEKEAIQWKIVFPHKPIVALFNTISGIDEILEYKPIESKDFLKKKYAIKEKIVLIFCARFESPYRRIDLLIELITKIESKQFGFIIIGDGTYKPDFSIYHNVYDFGALYDTQRKNELFSIADIYFQPGWVGLSIVEAMAYGKPVFTFERNEDTMQCVEYSYLINEYNGIIFKNIEDATAYFYNIDENNLVKMSNNAKEYVSKTLRMDMMVNRALQIL